MEKNHRLTAPLVSICMPVYNAGKFIAKTLDSIKNQTYENIEVLIVDDGSTDDSVKIAESFIPFLNLKISKQSNAGAGAARNKAFLSSQGQFIKFLDGDDLINETMLEAQVALALENPKSIISGKWGRFYNNDIETFQESPETVWRNMSPINWIVESWSKGPNMTQPGIFLIPRQLIDQYGLWKEELSKGPCDDMEFFTRMILNSNGIVFCEKSILYYNSGIVGSLSKKKDRKGYEYQLKTILLSINQLLEKECSYAAQKAANTQLKVFAYSSYAEHFDLYKKSKDQLKLLANSDYRFPAGGYTKVLVSFFGWKIASKIKILFA